MNTDARSLIRLMAWLSPAFPVGAFSYSHGLEQAAAEGLVSDEETLFDWLSTLLRHGSAWNDALLLKAAYEAADAEALDEVIDLALALSPSSERLRETRDQGAAFMTAANVWAEGSGVKAFGLDHAPYPVAVGAMAAFAGVPLAQSLTAYLQAFASNLVSVAIRAAPIGQTAGVRVLARLETIILAVADQALSAKLDDLGGAAMVSDIASMRHETLETRLFIS